MIETLEDLVHINEATGKKFMHGYIKDTDVRKLGEKWKEHFEGMDKEEPGCYIGGARIDYKTAIGFINHFFNLEIDDKI